MNAEIIVRNYLGDKGFELAEKWYLYTLQPEWDYVVFMVRRAYLAAQIMEAVTGRQMKESAAFFLTDAAFFARYEKIARFYVTYHRLPNILIAEDSVVHGRSIEDCLNGISSAIWEEVQKQTTQELDEDEFQNEFVKAVHIHVITKAATGLLLSTKYMMKIHSCTVQNLQELHELSYGISKLILHSGKANAAYVYSQKVTEKQYNILKALSKQDGEFSYNTATTDIKESFIIKFVKRKEFVKSVLSVRFLPGRDGGYRMIPFVFLPSLSKDETDALWAASAQKLVTYIDDKKVGQDYEEFLGKLADINLKRSYNEWLTLVLSLWWMVKLQLRSGMKREDVDDWDEIRTLAYNYNLTDAGRTEAILKAVVIAIWKMAADEKEPDVSEVIADCIHSDNYLILDQVEDQMEELDEKRIVEDLENYWIDITKQNEHEAYKALSIPRFAFDPKIIKRAIQKCEVVLRKLTEGISLRKAGYIIAQFQQMMDQGIIGIYSFVKRGDTERFFMQCVKPGEMSLTIYPKRMRDYISVFSRIYEYCEYWELDWKKVIIDFCSDEESGIPESDRGKIQDFIAYLHECGQDPQQWDIHFNIGEVNDKGEVREVNQEIERAVHSYYYWKRFEKYINK